MVALNYLKYTHDLSDEDVVQGWVENPYWQYMSGMKYFEHDLPIDPSSMTRWRSRIGESGAEAMLGKTIEVGKRLGLVKSSQLKRINVDTTVGRVIRDVERKAENVSEELRSLLETAKRIQIQERKSRDKVYSVHAPEVRCISKGKAHKRYEFGCKVSVAATSRGGWFVGAQALPGNPYDGHTMSDAMNQVVRVSDVEPEYAFVDRGYRGHDYEGKCTVHVDRVRRGRIAKSLWQWMKRRAAIEPGIGHLKHGHRMDRNRLKGPAGDMFNAILSAAGMNISKLRKGALDFLRSIIFGLSGRISRVWFVNFRHARLLTTT